jgi:hypothetical protein
LQVADYESPSDVGGSASPGPSGTPSPDRNPGSRRTRRRRVPATAPSSTQSKADLMRQAAALDVAGRTTMSKAQLVNAIKKAPAGRR